MIEALGSPRPVVIVTRVETDKFGVSRFVEQQTRPRPGGGGIDWLLRRVSRPIHDDETCEQAAANSIAFSPQADLAPKTHGRTATIPSFGGFSVYFADFPDGSSWYESFARPRPAQAVPTLQANGGRGGGDARRGSPGHVPVEGRHKRRPSEPA